MTLALASLHGASVFAQGHQGVPPGQAKKVATPPSGSHSPSTDASGSSISVGSVAPRVLGSWLDDATILDARATWVTVSTNRWQSPAGSGNDSPIVDVASGLTPRLQVAVTLPYSRFADESGNKWTGLGDLYFTAKIVLRRADAGRTGLAIAPTLEWTGPAAAFDSAPDRTHWVLPVNIELRRTGWRAYGSGGYFTRGALFAAGALERSLTTHWTVTGSLTQAWSTSDQAAADAYGLTRRRTDASGGASYSVSPALMLFGSVGRTLSRLEYDSSRLALNAGASVNLAGRRPARP